MYKTSLGMGPKSEHEIYLYIYIPYKHSWKVIYKRCWCTCILTATYYLKSCVEYSTVASCQHAKHFKF